MSGCFFMRRGMRDIFTTIVFIARNTISVRRRETILRSFIDEPATYLVFVHIVKNVR